MIPWDRFCAMDGTAPEMFHFIAVMGAATCAGLATISGTMVIEESGEWWNGDVYAPVCAAGVAMSWTWIVFPLMGRSWKKDVALILVAFPCIGAITGGLASLFLFPMGIAVGAVVAFALPFAQPLIALQIYLMGAVLAFALPRLQARQHA